MPTGASWGSGGFTVQQAGSLSLANVAVGAEITVQGNGTVHLQNVVWEGFAVASLSSNDDGPYAQCFQPYTTLRDSWRSTGTTGSGSHGDCSQTGVGGGRWYRFAGAGGDALPLTSPGDHHCGTHRTGWLSGWATP